MISLTKADLEAAPDFQTKAEREAEEQAVVVQQRVGDPTQRRFDAKGEPAKQELAGHLG